MKARLRKLVVSILSLSMLAPTLSGCDFDSFFSNVGDKASEVLENIESAGGEIASWGKDAWKNTISWGNDAWGTVSNWGKSTWESVASWSSNAGEAAANWTGQTVDGVKNWFCNVGDFTIDVANKAVAFGLKKGVESLDLTKGLDEEGEESDWKEYLSDYEAITYAILTTQLKKVYEVFPAKLVIPSSGQEVYGYAYTDYENAYVYHEGQEDEEIYYGSGFLPLVDEPIVPSEDAKTGIEINEAENSGEKSHYFYQYDFEPFKTHCVVKGQYLIYGVDENHQIFYENEDYKGEFDETLGGLYSYDEQTYLYGGDNGFIPKKGNIVDEAFDFETWKEEMSSFSGFSLSFDNLKGMVSDAVYKVKTVFNNINEQTILGYNINDVKKAINGTNEDDIATIEDEQVAMHSSGNEVPEGLDDTAKWIVGIGTGVALIADIAVALFFPKVTWQNLTLNAAVSAVSGAAVQLAIETISNNKGFRDVNWIKVGISAVAGAIAGLITTNSKIKCIVANSIVNSVVSSLSDFIDGKSFFDCALSFVSSFALSFLIAGAVTILVSGVQRLAQKVSPKLTQKTDKWIRSHQVIIGGKSMAATSDASNIARQASDSASASSVDQKKAVFSTRKAVKSLPGSKNKYFALTDESGNVISKSELLSNGGNGNIVLKEVNGGNKYATLFVDSKGNPVSRLPIKNGFVQFQYLDSTVVNLGAGNALLSNRGTNYKTLDDALKKALIENPSSVAGDVYNYFLNLGIDFDDLSYADFKTMRSVLNKTWHEAENRVSGILVDTTIHGAISHMGGVALAKAIAAVSFPSQLIFLLGKAVVEAA